jgi:hypothetical protein
LFMMQGSKKNRRQQLQPEDLWKRSGITSKSQLILLSNRKRPNKKGLAESLNKQQHDSVIKPLLALCLELISTNIQRYLSSLSSLPFTMRNHLLAKALQTGLLQKGQCHLLVHPEIEWLDLSHSPSREYVNDAFLLPFIPHVPALPTLDSWEEITADQIYVAPKGCPLLSKLSLAHCVNISKRFLEG